MTVIQLVRWSAKPPWGDTEARLFTVIMEDKSMRADLTISTTDGKKFLSTDHYDLARLVFKRFGHDPESAAQAWRRMLGNSTTVDDFMRLVQAPTHTPNCEGDCRGHDA